MRPSGRGRIVFFGSSDTGWRCCEALLQGGVNVAAIVTQARRFSISWSPTPVTNVRYRDLGELGDRYGVPVVDGSVGVRDDTFLGQLASCDADLLVVVGWYHMIPRRVRMLARLGAVAVHASLLPKYRGGAPLVWAVINGEAETGVTLFYLDDEVDAGDIVAQSRVSIGAADTIAEVIGRANIEAEALVATHVPRILDGTAPRVPQDHSRSSIVPQRRPEDGLIDWSRMSAQAVYNFVRAQTHPYPGAFAHRDGECVRIWRVAPQGEDVMGRPPGTWFEQGTRHRVVCADRRVVEIVDATVGGPQVP